MTARSKRPPGRVPALLLCAHGRGGSAEDHHVPEALARALRRRGDFAAVEACYLRGAPSLAEALAGIAADCVFLVPLLMADGHTSKVVLPDALAAAGPAAARVHVTPPVGVSAAWAPLVVAEVDARCRGAGWDPAAATVVIAAHGTARHKGSALSAERLAGQVAASGQFNRVEAAFLEQDPRVETALRAASPGPCVVVGFFLDHGGHSVDDIPRLIGENHPGAVYDGALGAHPGLADIVRALVSDAAGA